MRLKRFIGFVLCMALLCGLCVPASAAQKQTITVDPINIMVGGKVFLPTDVNGENVPVFVYEGTTYAPLRALAEAYGLTVGYDQAKNLATVDGTPSADFAGTKGTAQALTTRTTLPVSPINIEVGGVVFQPKDVTGKDVPVFVYNGTTYAPLRALAEAYGLTVGYDQEKNLATVDFDESAEIRIAANTRRTEFYSRITEVEASGTVYYISNSGNDSNDGLSPETAWATLDRAFETYWPLTRDLLKPGDVVLLERGGTWYVSPDEREGLTSDAYNIVEGVTLGAYGEGARPVIRGDIPEANDPAFWTLYHDENGVKIWASAEKLQDSNVIVFNDGESIAEEIMPHWSVSLNGYCNADGEPFDVTAELNEDLTFCSLLELDGYSPGQDLSNPVQSGTLYLRCDEGNPAEVFNEVVVPQAQTGLSLHTNSTITDLDLRYFTCIAAGLDGYDGNDSQQVLNCEVSWCGGLFHNYQPTEERPDGVLQPNCAGGALQVSGSGNSVRDCYIHHCGPMTLIISIHVDGPGVRTFENMTHSGNLIEYCGTALHIADYAKMDHPEADGFISNLRFTDNMVLHSGAGWTENLILQIYNEHSPFFSAIDYCALNNDGIYITGNVFYSSKARLICLQDNFENSTRPVAFSGNTYAQPEGGGLAIYNWERGWGVGYAPDEQEFLEFIGDKTGKIVRIP